MTDIDAVYRERNQVVAALARLLHWQGRNVVVARTDIPGWDPVWHGCVYIDGPEGQMSWHFHERDAHLFDSLPHAERAEWDGHTTEEKYQRLEQVGL